MIDYKYSFVCNEMSNNLYALVMNCWYIDEQGQKVEVKDSILVNKTLTECFELAQAFLIAE
jgi:hypothetical protein